MATNSIQRELRVSFLDKSFAHAYAEDFSNAAIATQIKVLREHRGMTQTQLAELAGMKQSRISLMEDVNYGSWNLKTLRRIAEALDVALVVGFETFSKLIKDASEFSRESLDRPSREEDLRTQTTPKGTQATLGGLRPSLPADSALAAVSSPKSEQASRGTSAIEVSLHADARRVRQSALSDWRRSREPLQAPRATALGSLQ